MEKWVGLVMGSKEGTYCVEYWVLYLNNDSWNTILKTNDVMYDDKHNTIKNKTLSFQDSFCIGKWLLQDSEHDCSKVLSSLNTNKQTNKTDQCHCIRKRFDIGHTYWLNIFFTMWLKFNPFWLTMSIFLIQGTLLKVFLKNQVLKNVLKLLNLKRKKNPSKAEIHIFIYLVENVFWIEEEKWNNTKIWIYFTDKS